MTDKAIEVMTARVGQSVAAQLLADLKAARIAVVELAEPAGQISVVAIDMEPEDDEGYVLDPELRIRFKDIPRPGRLFEPAELAGVLLAAAAERSAEA